MNNDRSVKNQNQPASQLPVNQGGLPADKPFETSSFGQEQESIFQVNLEHRDVLSLDSLRSKFPDPQERVEAIWTWLSAFIVDYVPYADRRESGLVMVDELVRLTGFSVGESTRQYFKDHLPAGDYGSRI